MVAQIHPNSTKITDFDEWIRLAKEHKAMWVEISDGGELPPTVFAERDGHILCAVIAPQVDKHQGLNAAAILRRGLAADTLTIVLDAHIRHSAEGESKDDFLKTYHNGDMQKACDEEGACERGEISDCLICHRIGQDCKIKMATLTYSYHGKKGGPFAWNNYVDGKIVDEHEEGMHLEGNIPDALREIIKIPVIAQDEFSVVMAEAMKIDKDRALYHCARATYSILTEQKFFVMDYAAHHLPYKEFKQCY